MANENDSAEVTDGGEVDTTKNEIAGLNRRNTELEKALEKVTQERDEAINAKTERVTTQADLDAKAERLEELSKRLDRKIEIIRGGISEEVAEYLSHSENTTDAIAAYRADVNRGVAEVLGSGDVPKSGVQVPAGITLDRYSRMTQAERNRLPRHEQQRLLGEYLGATSG